MPDQEQKKRVDALNLRFIEFGLTPSGALKFKWIHSTEMHWFILSDAKTLIVTPEKGRTAYRYSYADVYGPTWVLAHWVEPVSEDEWCASGRGDFPWPRNGEYHPIGTFVMHEGKEPYDAVTLYAVKCLRRHLGKIEQTARNTGTDGVQQLVDQEMDIIKAQKRSERSQLESEINDTLTAFGKIPGREDGGVGLGYSRRKILDSGGTPIEPLSPDIKEGEIIQ